MGKNENVTISDLYKLIKDSSEQNTNLHKELKEELKSLKEDLGKQVTQLYQENEKLKQANKKLEKQVQGIERKQKKYNIVIYGVQGEEDDTQTSVLAIINDNLKINCSQQDIRDIFRIGKQTTENPRPVVVEFINYRLKIDVLKNVSRLQNTGIFADHDYILEDYQNRKFLRSQLRIAKEGDPGAKIKNNILVCKNQQYSINQLKENPLEHILKRGESRQIVKVQELNRDEREAEEGTSKNFSSGRPKRK